MLRRFDYQVSAVPWALFRIGVALALLAEYLHLLYFRQVLAPSMPLAVDSLAAVGATATVGLALGKMTRLAAAVNYACAAALFGVIAVRLRWSYHADSYMLTGSLLVLVVPVNRALALDRCGVRDRYNNQFSQTAGTVGNHYTLLLAVAMSAVYLDAFTWKICDGIWWRGLGVWVPASQPFATYLPIGFLGRSELLARALGYMTLAYQLAFPALVWFELARLPLALVGMGMHLAIGLVFPIPIFGFVAAVFYLPLVPAWCYRRIGLPVQGPQRDRRGRSPALVAILGALWVVSWPIINLQSALHERTWFSAPASKLGRLERLAASLGARYGSSIYKLTGMEAHPVFLGLYFEHHQLEHRLEVDGRQVPIVNADGSIGAYGFNRNWCVWSFFEYGEPVVFEKFGKFWAAKNGVEWSQAKLRVYERRARVSMDRWEPRLLDENLTRKWEPVE